MGCSGRSTTAPVWILLAHAIVLSYRSAQAWEVHISPTAQQLQNRKSGENVGIICSVIGLPKNLDAPVHIDWYREESDLPIARLERIAVSRSKALSARLLFIKPTVDDGGLYKCLVGVGADQTKEKSTRISFIQAAEFINVARDQHPVENQDAQIVCRVQGDSSLEIFWQFDGKNIIDGGARNYELRENNQVLFIPNFQSSLDDGEYTCNVAQFYSFESVAINVTAYARPQITVLEGSETNEGVEGKDFNIRCQAVGKPKPTYKWVKNVDGEEKEIPSEKYVLSDHASILNIKKLIPADHGIYSCIAKNDLDQVRMDYNLTVFRKPVIKPMSNITIKRGETVELVCEFGGDGKVKAKWLHVGQQWLGDGGHVREQSAERKPNPVHQSQDGRVTLREEVGLVALTLPRVGEDDAGQYQCVAENEAGFDQNSVFLSIIHAARVIDHNGVQRILSGFNAQLKCEASAVPDPEWTWFGPQGIIDADGIKYVIDSLSVKSTLQVTNADSDDFGEYMCAAENGIGEPDQAQLQLVEIKSPELPTNFKCHEQVYPNFAICRINDFKDISRMPTNLTFFIVKDDSGASDREQIAMNYTYGYAAARDYRLIGLAPRSKYLVRIQSHNEAGSSNYSQPNLIHTTDPWAPDALSNVEYECQQTCKLNWREPNDRGSPILAYKLILKEIARNEPIREFGDETFELNLGAEDLAADLSFLKPLTTYELRIMALNDVGSSNIYTTVLNTSDYTADTHPVEDRSWRKIILFVIIFLILLLIIIDLSCFVTNRCGFFATICVECFGCRLPSDKQKSTSSNDKAENNRLLSEERSDAPTPSIDGQKRCKDGPHSTPV